MPHEKRFLINNDMRVRSLEIAVIAALLLPITALARLGETREQILARYGKPVKVDEAPNKTCGLLWFQKNGMKIGVCFVYAVDRNVASEMFYEKITPLSTAQIVELLRRNAEDSEWVMDSTTDARGRKVWTRKDGAKARYSPPPASKPKDKAEEKHCCLYICSARAVLLSGPAGGTPQKELDGL